MVFLIVMDPLVFLPTELACDILSDWLTLKCLVRVDSAYCNSETRSALLRSLNSPFLTVQTNPSHNLKSKYRDWIMLRNIRVSKVLLYGNEDLRKFGSYAEQCHTHIEDLSLHSYRDEFRRACEIIVDHCYKIKSLGFNACCLDPSIIEVMSSCTQLNLVQLINCDDQSRVISQKKASANLEHVRSIEIVDHSAGAITQKLLELATGIEKLKISSTKYGSFYLQPRSTALISVCLSKQEELRSTHIADLCIDCPNIQHLDLSHNYHLDDECSAEVASLAQLQTLNVNRCNFSNMLLTELAAHRAATLQVVCISFNSKMTVQGVRTLMQKCTKVQSLYCTTQQIYYDAEHSMQFLGNLTTLSLVAVRGLHPLQAVLELVGTHCKQLVSLSVMFFNLMQVKHVDFASFDVVHQPQLQVLVVSCMGNSKVDVDACATLTALHEERPTLLVFNDRDRLVCKVF